MVSVEDVQASILKTHWPTSEPLKASTDLFGPLYGDDAWDLLESYARAFTVDMANFLWYFHSVEEDAILPFFKPPDRCVKHIAVTPEMLAQFANGGARDIVYPEHMSPLPLWERVAQGREAA